MRKWVGEKILLSIYDAVGDLKVLRGGSWASDAVQCRVDARGRNHAGNRDYTIGFRFVVC